MRNLLGELHLFHVAVKGTRRAFTPTGVPTGHCCLQRRAAHCKLWLPQLGAGFLPTQQLYWPVRHNHGSNAHRPICSQLPIQSWVGTTLSSPALNSLARGLDNADQRLQLCAPLSLKQNAQRLIWCQESAMCSPSAGLIFVPRGSQHSWLPLQLCGRRMQEGAGEWLSAATRPRAAEAAISAPHTQVLSARNQPIMHMQLSR